MKGINPIFNRYKKSIVKIEESNLNEKTNINRGLHLSKTCLNKFNKIVRSGKFTSKEDEITFFKHQKPYIEGRLLYFKKLKTHLLTKPVSGIDKQIKFTNSQLNRIDSQKCKKTEFVQYYRLEETKLDHIYFLRGNDQLDLFIDTIPHYKDPEFCTSHDYLVSKIIAHDLLIKFYTSELNSLKRKLISSNTQEESPSTSFGLNWTGTKGELALITYMLKNGGYINNGNVEINKIAEAFSLIFNIELSNIYKIYAKMKSSGFDSSNFTYITNQILDKMFQSD